MLWIQTVGGGRRHVDYFDQQRDSGVKNASGMDQPVVFEYHHQKRQHGFQPAETVDDHSTRLARVLPG